MFLRKKWNENTDQRVLIDFLVSVNNIPIRNIMHYIPTLMNAKPANTNFSLAKQS